MLANGSDYLNLLEQVKGEIATTRSEVAARASAGLVAMHWRIGCHLNEELNTAPAS